MIFEDGSGLSDEFQSYHTLDGYDFQEVISIPMSGYVKQPQYDLMSFPPEVAVSDQDALYQHIANPYPAHIPSQHTLTAMPHANEEVFNPFENNGYHHTYEYPPSRVSCASDSATQSVSTSTVESLPLQAVVNQSQISKKRKVSVDSVDDTQHLHKKPTITHVHIQDPHGEYYDFSAQTSPYSSFVPTPAAGPTVQGHQSNSSPRAVGHQYSTSNASQVSLTAPSPYTPAISPSFTTANTDQSPRAPTTPAPRPVSAASPYSTANPKLIRTSTIPQQPSPGLAPAMGTNNHAHAFNPYAMYPPNAKACLRLIGDLDAVAKDWTAEELDQRRKLVVFKRSQDGSVIDAEFEVVSQQNWNRADPTVNCIWWKEKNEAFVTSVDTIALLEQLVGVRFTVEEKNRIRRNLEGFRPLTVSKAKSDSEDFFKVIMGFPNPKPRNIEKDVKVFPWKILSGALKKIISKYSASYSSTAATLAGGTAPTFAHMEVPREYQYPSSPSQDFQHVVPQGTIVMGYPHEIPQARMTANLSHIPELQLQVPISAPGYAPVPHYPYGPVQYTQAPSAVPAIPYTPQVVSAPAGQIPSGWGFQGVPHGGPGQLGSSSAPPSAYPHHLVETTGFPTQTTFNR